MNTPQNETPTIDAEVIEDNRSLTDRSPFVQLPHQAAAAVEAVASTVEPFLPEAAGRMRAHASTVRTVAHNAEQAAVAGAQLVGTAKTAASSIKDALKKMGWNPDLPSSRIPRSARQEWRRGSPRPR